MSKWLQDLNCKEIFTEEEVNQFNYGQAICPRCKQQLVPMKAPRELIPE